MSTKNITKKQFNDWRAEIANRAAYFITDTLKKAALTDTGEATLDLKQICFNGNGIWKEMLEIHKYANFILQVFMNRNVIRISDGGYSIYEWGLGANFSATETAKEFARFCADIVENCVDIDYDYNTK